MSQLVVTATKSAGWRYGRYQIEPLAQDQVVFEVDRGDEYVTYKGLRVDSKDPQSETIATRQCEVSSLEWAALMRELNRCVAVAWNGDDVLIEAKRSVDVEVVFGGAETDDALDQDEESAEVLSPEGLATGILELDAERDSPRLRELVVVAEDTDFSPEQSVRLAPRLLELAIQYRDSNDTADKPVVWSAIRTGASMLRPNEAVQLIPLLDSGHSIETSRVAVKMVGRIFEAQPPDEVDQFSELAGEILGIAQAFLNPHIIAIPASAATAQLAVYALAAMASSATLGVVQDVRELGVSWFTRQTEHDLRELRSYWDEHSDPVASEVLDLLDRATQELCAS